MRGWKLPKSGRINCDNVDEKSTGELFEEAKKFILTIGEDLKLKSHVKANKTLSVSKT